jgi:1-acyl-sn-glycerol-3-phosphate acyltransferase
MWLTLSLALVSVLFVWLPWKTALLLVVAYTLYSPTVWHELRRMNTMFSWLRTKHCNLSYTGNVRLLHEQKARIFVLHPHGVHCVGAVLLSSDPALTHVRVAGTSILFWLPLIKEFCVWGNAVPCDRKSLQTQLKNNTPVMLYPGGLNEIPGAHFLRQNDEELHLSRTGFIALAMAQEVEIVPCWVDGETELYTVYHPWPALQQLCYRFFRYPWPLFSWGWHWVPFLPKSKTLTIHVGTAIPTVKTGSLAVYHAQYQSAIRQLKKHYGPAGK